jgi:DNA-binding transcriptional ArsR family regulator
MMDSLHDNPYTALERVFHEPNRLAIMSSLGGAVEGLTFGELKELCGLTDGNLSRHLKTLEEAQAIRLDKKFVGARPRTTVYLADAGREGFIAYLQALEAVLQRAGEAMAMEEARVPMFGELQGPA